MVILGFIYIKIGHTRVYTSYKNNLTENIYIFVNKFT